MPAMGSSCQYRWSFTHMPSTHVLRCSPVPSRPQNSTGLWPGSWGPPSNPWEIRVGVYFLRSLGAKVNSAGFRVHIQYMVRLFLALTAWHLNPNHISTLPPWWSLRSGNPTNNGEISEKPSGSLVPPGLQTDFCLRRFPAFTLIKKPQLIGLEGHF